MYGKVQPPRYLYVGGDGRLKLSKQSTINTTLLFTLKPLFLLPLFGDFARVHRISTIELRAVQSGLTQPIIADHLRRGPSRGAGASGSKSTGSLSCVSRFESVSRGRVAEYLPRHRGYTRTCSCDAFSSQHQFFTIVAISSFTLHPWLDEGGSPLPVTCIKISQIFDEQQGFGNNR